MGNLKISVNNAAEGVKVLEVAYKADKSAVWQGKFNVNGTSISARYNNEEKAVTITSGAYYDANLKEIFADFLND